MHLLGLLILTFFLQYVYVSVFVELCISSEHEVTVIF